MAIETCTLSGKEIAPLLSEVAALRIAVFAEFPYLYDGDTDYEESYLRDFAGEPGSVLIGAFDGQRLVGIATASPMAGQKAEFRAPFEARGLDTARLFYFGESVLLPDYRGRGIGHAFFDRREAAARAAGATHACFAAVVRGPDHPARPLAYRPLDEFWRKRGYGKVSGLVTHLSWKEHGDAAECAKPMQCWMRTL
ncbi:GNAT family N-acetyltransferase [Altericroceibacterium xinjiangense]|uniref:GNAT family N-acetyltransferase n=1 Tax=Altericroceibacterium xinjiangense TaxID=762261 RepID=UPI000F7DBB41|nr:GNAT family N-acetyltransferase [Altericroceibacterium xinjiangense]